MASLLISLAMLSLRSSAWLRGRPVGVPKRPVTEGARRPVMMSMRGLLRRRRRRRRGICVLEVHATSFSVCKCTYVCIYAS